MSNQASLGEISESKSSNRRDKVDSKNKGYKKVRIDPKKVNIPVDWDFKTLREFSDKVTDGTHQTPDYVDEGIRFLSTKNLVPHSENFDFSDYVKYISEDEHKDLIERCRPENGDLLVSKCGTIGRSQLIRNDIEFSIFVGLALVKLQKADVNGTYLEEFVNSKPIRKVLQSRSPGSTRNTLNIGSLEGLEVPIPPISEQRRIASVLYNVDQAIQKTEEIIEQTQRVKKGLMQDLFTEGYCDHKDTKELFFGEIPEDWKFVPLEECAEVTKLAGFEYTNQFEEDEEGNIYALTAVSLKNNKLNISKETKRISREKAEELDRSKLREDDVAFTYIGAYIGECAYIPESEKYHLGPNVAKISPNSELFGKFLHKALQTSLLNKQIRARVSSTGQSALSMTKIRQLKVPIPEEDEQKEIVRALESFEEEIEKYKEEKKQLQRIKKGLMQDLLTGKVRTKDKDLEVLDEVLEVEE